MKTPPAPLLVALCAVLAAAAGLACSQSKDHGAPPPSCTTPECAAGIGGGGYAPVFPQDGSLDGETGETGTGTDTGSSGSDSGATETATDAGTDAGTDASTETATETGGGADAPTGG